MKTPLLAFAAVAIAGFAPSRISAQEAGIKIGAEAPVVPVELLDGRQVELATLYGDKPVVLEFWATWCPLCRKLEPAFHAAEEKYAGQVAFVNVGVSSNQSPERQAAYVAKHQLGGQFVFDRSDAAQHAFAAPHTSYVVVMDKNHKVVYTGVGPDQDIDAAVRKALR
jgi:thiol-disulfide isomerase/thioredoxin